MGILIDNRQKQHKVSTKQIQTTAQALLNALDNPDSELSILITDDTEIAQLNLQYRNRKGPTNVLSFPMHEGDFSEVSPEMLGDVVISAETAAREGKELGFSFVQRLNFLLVHGILHLFGYDHEISDDEAIKMDKKTEELYELIKDINIEDE
jgi:rRNA maturation RNase YbeY